MVRASKALGIGREAVMRIYAGFDVRAGTLALAEQRLAAESPPSHEVA
jgi:hypothetical protein